MSTASHSSTLNILYGLAQHLAQQLKSFICNVPLPHRSSFRCKRSNNFLNKRQKKEYLQNSNTTNNQWII